MRVLVVEDDPKISRFIMKGLDADGFQVDVASDVESALTATRERIFDLIILDLKLPDGSGLDVLRSVRSRSMVPMVIVLSAFGEIENRVEGLELGADDYMTKPFSFVELRARVKALFRRRSEPEQPNSVGVLKLDRRKCQVTITDRVVPLTKREFELLAYFVENAGETITRTMIADRVWNQGFDSGTNVIDVYVNYLRRKIGSGAIKSVRGVGYYLDVESLTASGGDAT